EGDLVVARQARRLVQVQRGRPRLERLVGAGDRDPVLADGLDLVAPGIDEGHVVAGAGQECPDVAPDGPGANEEEPLAHVFLPMRWLMPMQRLLHPGRHYGTRDRALTGLGGTWYSQRAGTGTVKAASATMEFDVAQGSAPPRRD